MDRVKHAANLGKVGAAARTVDLKEVSPPTLHLAALGLCPAAHLKGLKSQCRDRYSIE